ncbi:MAG: hypothetical protein WDA74_00315 [Spirochaetota bacterium]
MKKIFLLPVIIFLFSIYSGLSGQDNAAINQAKPEELIHLEEMLSIAKVNIDFLNSEQIEADAIKEKYAEAENLFFALKYSHEIRDPELLKRYLSSTVDELVSESGDRVDFVNRMTFLYWMMVGIGLLIILTLLVYSVYMYAKRK